MYLELKKNAIRDGGSTALYTVYMAYTVYTVNTIYIVYTIQTVLTVACLPIYIVREAGSQLTFLDGGGGQGRNKQKCHVGGVTTDLLDV